MKNSPCEHVVVSRLSGRSQHRRAPRRALRISAPPLPSGTPDHYFAAIVQSCDEAIIGKTSNGIVTSWNRAAEELFGYTEKEMVGHPLLRLFPLDRLDEEYYIDERILAGERVPAFDTVRIRKDGTPVDVAITMSAVRDDDGRIVGVCKMARDISSRRRQQERQQHDAQFDVLTGLPNRALLTDRLHQALALCKRNERRVAVICLDLDGFRQINNEHGSEAADAILIALSQRICGTLRAIDTLARVDGDEFVLVLAEVDGGENLRRVLDRILKSCSDPVFVNDRRVALSASMGVTVYPEDDADEHQLIRHADLAMYEAKQAGKNRYHVFDASRDAADKSRHTNVRRVAEALHNNELILHYQPKINMKSGTVVGAEALIRWQHPERGLLHPAQFLPLIDGHGLNEEIGIWVVGCALRQMETWRQAGIHMPVSVNLAPNQLQNEDFPAALAGLLARYPELDPGDLELEVLETSALQDINAASRVMRLCRELGVQFSIDDFGTGYSSLTYLKRLPACTLKIDQSFVRDMLTDHEDLAIVRGVIGLAKAFRRKVIAEGVETMEHGKMLLQMGCELAQGYGVSRPMPAENLAGWLSRWNAEGAWQ